MYTREPSRMLYLSQAEVRLVTAAANAFFPKGGPIPVAGTEAGIPRWFDRYFGRADPYNRALMRLMLAFTELSPLVFGPRPLPFSRLKQEHRIAVLQSASESRIYLRRVAFVGLRALMTMAYFADARVAEHIGTVPDADPFDLGDAPPFEGVGAPAPAASKVRLKRGAVVGEAPDVGDLSGVG